MSRLGSCRLRLASDFGSVWSQITTSLAKIRSIFAENEEILTGLRKFTLKLVAAATEKVGWYFGSDEDFLTGQLRALLVSTAANAGHQP